MSLNRIYYTVRKYIMTHNGNIFKFFQETDLNKDNFISKAEMKIALEKLGHQGITDDEVGLMFSAYD